MAKKKKTKSTAKVRKKLKRTSIKKVELTPKQKLFIQEFLVDLNSAAAARRAGYSSDTARLIGHENLTKLNIQNAIKKAMKERSDRLKITQNQVIQQLIAIAFSNVSNIQSWDQHGLKIKDSNELTPEETTAIDTIQFDQTTFINKQTNEKEIILKSKLKMVSKIAALELLGKHLGMFDGNESDWPPPSVVEAIKILDQREK